MERTAVLGVDERLSARLTNAASLGLVINDGLSADGEHGRLLGDEERPAKHRLPWGYLPLRQEVLPRSNAAKAAAAFAGLLCGLRVCLTTVGYATIIFTFSQNPEVSRLYPTGVRLLWLSASCGIVWNGLFGRLQYSVSDIQGAVAVLLFDVVHIVTTEVAASRRAATALVAISVSSIAVGAAFLVAGCLRFGRLMLQFPVSATCGFLASIGFSLARAGLQLASQTEFHMFYPTDWGTGKGGFLAPDSVGQIAAACGVVLCMRGLPRLLAHLTPPNARELRHFYPALGSLLPVTAFYATIWCAGVSLDHMRDRGWVYDYPQNASLAATFDERDLIDADWGVLAREDIAARIAVLIVVSLISCPLALVGISDHFADEPKLEGDPAPLAPLDIDQELKCTGVSAVFIGLAGGVATYHSLGNSVQSRIEGGTHRMSSLIAGGVLFALFLTGAPLQAFIPKYVLAGILINIGGIFIKQGLFDSVGVFSASEYLICLLTFIVELLSAQLVWSLSTGLALAVLVFVFQASRSSPVASAASGADVRSTVRRPDWESEILNRHGQRTLVLRLSGMLFFGTVSVVSSTLQRLFEAPDGQGVAYVLLDFTEVTYADTSAARGFSAIRARAEGAGKRLLFCAQSPAIAQLFQRTKAVGASCDLHADTDTALEWCEERILAEHGGAQCHLSRGALCDWCTPTAALFTHLLGLPPDAVGKLDRWFRGQHHHGGQRIIAAGAVCDSLVLVRSGAVDIVASNQAGRRRRRVHFRCGSFVGVDSFLGRLPHQGDAVVCGSPGAGAELWHISMARWRQLREEDEQLHAVLLDRLVEELAALSSIQGASICGFAGAELVDRIHAGRWI